MQSREQSHLKCQLSCPLACTSQGPAGALANTCVCAALCIHVSCATGLTEASHVQRLLQNADPNPRSSRGYRGLSPCYVPALVAKQGFCYLEPGRELRGLLCTCSFCFNEEVHSLQTHMDTCHLPSWDWWPTEDCRALFLLAKCRMPLQCKGSSVTTPTLDHLQPYSQARNHSQ